MNTTKIIYIAGPITGMKDLNKPVFDAAARQLRALGYIVRNPLEFCQDIPEGSDWHVYMRRCLPILCECTDIILLKGWKHSKGANLEMYNAQLLDMNVHEGVEGFELSVLQNRESEVA